MNPGDAGSDGQYLQIKDGTRRVFTTVGFDAVSDEDYSAVAGSFDFRLTCLGARTGFGGGGCADGFAFSLLDTGGFGSSGPVASQTDGTVALGEGSDAVRYSDGVPLQPGLTVSLAIFAPPPVLNTGNVWVSDGDRSEGFLVDNPGVDLVTGINSARGEFLSLTFEADFETDLFSLSISDGLTETSLFADADIAFLGLDAYNSRLAFGARSGDAGLFVDIDNVNLRFTPAERVSAVPTPATLPMMIAGLFIMGRFRSDLVLA